MSQLQTPINRLFPRPDSHPADALADALDLRAVTNTATAAYCSVSEWLQSSAALSDAIRRESIEAIAVFDALDTMQSVQDEVASLRSRMSTPLTVDPLEVAALRKLETLPVTAIKRPTAPRR
jgi:hypothetical protein